MRTVGVLSTALMTVVLVGAVVVGVRSIPDVKRYMAIRNM